MRPPTPQLSWHVVLSLSIELVAVPVINLRLLFQNSQTAWSANQIGMAGSWFAMAVRVQPFGG